jgi:hypothetical protein
MSLSYPDPEFACSSFTLPYFVDEIEIDDSEKQISEKSPIKLQLATNHPDLLA